MIDCLGQTYNPRPFRFFFFLRLRGSSSYGTCSSGTDSPKEGNSPNPLLSTRAVLDGSCSFRLWFAGA